MDNHTTNFEDKSSKELKKLLEFYEKRHKQARDAYQSDSVEIWDQKMKEYMEYITEIEQILNERDNI